MKSSKVAQDLREVGIHCAEQSQNVSAGWDASLQEMVNPENTSQEKEVDCMYYPYGGSLTGVSLQEPSWGTVLTFGTPQNSFFGLDQGEKKKPPQELGHQQPTVSLNSDTRYRQISCSNSSTSQDLSGHCALYFNDKSEADLLKQQQNGIFLTECDLAKLSDLAPDIMNLEGSVSSELLKVVDTEDEEDLVVDDSDTESEISVSDAGSYVTTSQCQYELHCMVCGLPRSQTVEANFLQVDNTYPLTFVSKTPVILKLVEIIPADLHQRLNLNDSLICRRCFNLIDTAENLELRLSTVKQELYDFVARTQTPLSEVKQRNVLNRSPFIGAETLCTPAGLPGSCQSLNVSELPRHNSHMPKCGFTDNKCLVDSRTCNPSSLSYAQNGVQFCQLKIPCMTSLSACNYNSCPHPQGIGFNMIQYPQSVDLGKETSFTSSVSNKEDTVQTDDSCRSQKEGQVVESTNKFAEEKNIVEKSKLDEFEKHKKRNRRNVEDCRDRFQCDRCGRTYSQKSNLMHHLKKHDGDFRYKCEHCFKGYSVEQNLILHLRSHKDLRPFLCNRCPASFFNADDLQGHQLFCIDKMYPCSKCTKIFVTSQKLSEHIQFRHRRKVDVDFQYECDVCGKQFRYPTDLTHHSTSHKDDKSHHCHLCGRMYKHKRHLNRHQRINHKNQSHERKYAEISNGRHVHHGNQENSSKKCNRQFKRKNLKAQKKNLSSKEKPLKSKSVCPICDKAVWKLKVHMISHTNIKGFSCSICGVEFSLKQGLDRHIRNKHASTCHASLAIS